MAWSLTGSALVVLAAALVLLGLNASQPDASRLNAGQIGLYGLLSVGALAYAGAGGLIARRVPGNAIGWLLSLAGLTLTVAMLTEQYALYGLATNPGTVPAAKIAGVLSADRGRPDRDPAVRSGPAVPGRAAAVAALAPGPVGGGRRDGRIGRPAVPGRHHDQRRPHRRAERAQRSSTRIRWGLSRSTAGSAISWSESSSSPSSPPCSIVASVFVRRRGASPERRQQLAWLGYVGALTVVWAVLLVLANFLVRGQANGLVTGVFWSLMFLTPVAGIPLACVVAVLKYRLYDLGRIVSRTVTYAIVTGLLVGIYAGLVLLATEVIGLTSPVAVAGSTLAAAALFGPLRSRVQKRVDHRFNRARYDAERMLAAFAARLTEELDADAVTADLARSVRTALEPAHISIWLSE